MQCMKWWGPRARWQIRIRKSRKLLRKQREQCNGMALPGWQQQEWRNEIMDEHKMNQMDFIIKKNNEKQNLQGH